MKIPLISRGIQIVFALATLILSAYLVGSRGPGAIPPILAYGIFCGAFGLAISFVGLGAGFTDQDIIHVVAFCLDVLASCFLFAGGIAFAVKTPKRTCSDSLSWEDLTEWTNSLPIYWPSLWKNYGTSDYETTDYGSNDYGTSGYGTSDYGTNDYGTTDYGDFGNVGEIGRRFLTDIKTRCGIFTADMVLLWLLLGTFVVTLILGFTGRMKKPRASIT